MGKLTTNTNKIILYITTFLTLYFSSSFSLSTMSGTGRLLLFVALGIFLLLYKGRKMQFKVSAELGAMIALAFLAYIVNGESMEQLVILAAYILFPLLYVNCFSLSEWQKGYSDVMIFVSAFSLIVYFSSIFFPGLIERLPVTQNSLGTLSHEAFFSITPINNRNYGPFWEPGAFQMYINIALIIEFYTFKFQNKKSIIVLLLALITTFSTTGYLAAGFIFLCILLESSFDKKNKKRVVTIVVLLLVVFFAVSSVFSDIQLDVFDKVFGKVDNYQVSREEYSTVGVRLSSFFVPFEILFDSILQIPFGVGPTYLHDLFQQKYGHSMTTCTFANLFAIYGVFYALLFLSGILKFTKCIASTSRLAFGLLIAIIICTLSEDFSRDASFFIIPFYGLSLAKSDKIRYARFNQNILI